MRKPGPREKKPGYRALGGTRTPNLLIRSQMLYPLSYKREVDLDQCSHWISINERLSISLEIAQSPHCRWYLLLGNFPILIALLRAV